jgi:hypothetical protein
MGAPENMVKNACLQYLNVLGIMAWSNNTGAVKYRNGAGADRFLRFGYKGSADIIGCMPDGRFLAVECKTEKGRVSESQREFLAGIKKSGGVAVVARCVEDVAEVLQAEGY